MANVFERSLIRSGEGGLSLVIPKSWAAYYGLEAGDVVRVKTDAKLVIEPKVVRKWKRKGK